MRPAGGRRRARRARLADRRRRVAARPRPLARAAAAAPGDRRGRRRRGRRGHREAAGAPRFSGRPRLRSRAAGPRSVDGDAGPRRPAPAGSPFAGRLGTGDRGGGRGGRRLAADAAAHPAQRGSGGRPRPRDRRSSGGAARRAGRVPGRDAGVLPDHAAARRDRAAVPRAHRHRLLPGRRPVRGGHDLRNRTAGRTLSPALAGATHACCGSGGSCAAAASSP